MFRRHNYKTALIMAAVLAFVAVGLISQLAHGITPEVGNRFDQLSNSAAGATATNLIGFTINETSAPLGSIELQFCSNNPLPSTSCTSPNGLDASQAVLKNQTGNTGFIISPQSTANEVILSHIPANPHPHGAPNTYQLNNVVNPAQAGSYYVRIYIYPTIDASGAPTEVGGLALAATGGLSVSAVVPPYLKFCAGVTIKNYDCATASNHLINFGNFSPSHASAASSQFVVATNAGNGYNITVSGPTLTSGNNIIPALKNPTPSASGNSQFGINLRANSFPAVGANPSSGGSGQVASNYNQPNFFSYKSGQVLVSSSGVSDNKVFTISYLANISHHNPLGVYATTLTYICLANF
ncbi:MAG: hypothetical protein ACREGA_04680 [Candidatus Saccharimonadales bacterium]